MEIEKLENKRKIKRSKKRKMIVYIVISLLCIILSLGAFFYWYIGKFSNKNSLGVIKGQDSINVLFLGLDIGVVEDKERRDLKRTDTMMLAHVNTVDNTVKVVSIPRDTLFEYGGKPQKINSAYELGGDDLVKKTIEDMLAVKVHYVAKVDYEGFREIIDAIGGVEMPIERDMIYDDDVQDLHIRFYKGDTVKLDGKKSEEFFRWRQNNDGTGFNNGDLDRIENQHKFINRLLEKVKAENSFSDFIKILSIMPKYIQTDMNEDAIINYGKCIFKIKKENFKVTTLNVYPKYIGNISYVVFDKTKNEKIIKDFTDSVSNFNNLSKDSVSIKIINSTKIKGLATELKNQLENNGYTRIDVASSDLENSKSEIQIKDVKYKALISNNIKIKKYVELPTDEKIYDVIIILGKDYKKFGEE